MSRKPRRTKVAMPQQVTPIAPRKPAPSPAANGLSEAARAAMKHDIAIENFTTLLYGQPVQAPKRTPSLEEVRALFALPVTHGAPEDERKKLDMAFDAAGGFAQIHSSLSQHLSDLGQMPMASFLGYGALQNLAQDPLIRECVQTVADDLTRKWIEIVGGEKSDTERVTKLQQLQKRYRLQSIVHDAAVMVGFYGGAFIFIDTGVEGEELEYPLNIKDECWELRKGANLSFRVIDPVNVTPCDYNCENPLKGDYMRPNMWWVLGRKVHHTRLLPLLENEPPTLLKPSYNFLGIPRAQLLADYVAHFKEARTYVLDLIKKISMLVYKTDTAQVFYTPDGAREFDMKIQSLQRYRDLNSIAVCDKEREDITNIQTSIAGATDVVRQQLEFVAAINRTPAVKALGISPSGFNATGESDIRNYYDHVSSQQELYRDVISKCLHAIELVSFGNIDPTINFEFVELAEDNTSSKAMNASTYMQTIVAAIQAQVISAEEGRQALRAYKDAGFDFLSEDLPAGDMVDVVGNEDVPAKNPLFELLHKQQSEAPQTQAGNDADKYNHAQIEADNREEQSDKPSQGNARYRA